MRLHCRRNGFDLGAVVEECAHFHAFFDLFERLANIYRHQAEQPEREKRERDRDDAKDAEERRSPGCGERFFYGSQIMRSS